MVILSLRSIVASLFFASVAGGFGASAQVQKADPVDRSRAHGMLRNARDEMKSHYYDPTFHGIDLNARYKDYDARIDAAKSLGEMFHDVAAFLTGFNDSHLFFLPPPRGTSITSDYRMQIVGDKCFVTHVRPNSDAADKLLPGDQVATFNGFTVNRDEMSNLNYYFHLLEPQPADHLEIAGTHGTAPVDVKPRVKKGKLRLDLTGENGLNDYYDMLDLDNKQNHYLRERWVENESGTVWKMANFEFSEEGLNSMMEVVRKHPALILDLRGNPGGYISSLESLVGRLFDHDVKIADKQTRKPEKPQLAKHTSAPYQGKIIVLIDSDSGSSAELFARTMQLEHRGTVLGDRSAGAVMEAQVFPESAGVESLIFYGFSITRANLIMTDGKSLEKTGVTPDEVILPTAKDIASGRDPVMAKAADMIGWKLSLEAAGKLFPYEWPPE